ncbi:RNA helicase [Tulasnella sp. 419]|nr:RNA helicase [Tulasnella sp. 419]
MSTGTSDEEDSEFEGTESIMVVDTFDQLDLKDDLLMGMDAQGFEQPSAIQQRAILPIISGRDVIVQAPTGEGRTAMFSIAILQLVDTSSQDTQALILSPTRGLATQTQGTISALGEYMGVKCHACIGGTPIREDIQILSSGIHVVSGAPGRVSDMIGRQKIHTKNIKILVLNEADELLDEGFKDKIFDIYRSLPPKTQVVMIASTLPHDIQDIVTKFMTEPIQILSKQNNSDLEGIKQFSISVKKEKGKYDALHDLLDELQSTRVVVFCNSRHKVDLLSQKLQEANITVFSMHSKKVQAEQTAVMDGFQDNPCGTVITTDIWATKAEVSAIINYDVPIGLKKYAQRIGSSHLGRNGIVINFVTAKEVNVLRDIERFYSTNIDQFPNDTEDLLSELLGTGEEAEAISE